MKLGYRYLGRFVDNKHNHNDLWLIQKNSSFIFLNSFAREIECARNDLKLYGNHLLFFCNDTYYLCEPSTENQANIYKPKDGLFFFLWDNNDCTELTYLNNSIIRNNTIEFIKKDNYVALIYHPQKESSRDFSSDAKKLKEKPYLDTIISREKGICHIKCFVYFTANSIVVDDGTRIIVYDNNFNIKYEDYCDSEDYVIWEMKEKFFLVFPTEGTLYDIVENKVIELANRDTCYWEYAKTYKDILILYEQKPLYYDDYDIGEDETHEYLPENIPISNSSGHIFNSSLVLLREFYVPGEIIGIKEFGDKKILETQSTHTEDNDTISYYNIEEPNITIHIKDTHENFSLPNMAIREMIDYAHKHLFIVQRRALLSDYISPESNLQTEHYTTKYGIYIKTDYQKETYKKIIDCKYDYIKSLFINDDNIYYAGFINKHTKCYFDLYINHKMILSGISYKNKSKIDVIDNGLFIEYTNNDGNIGIIRNGTIIIKPQYKDVLVCIRCLENYLSHKTNILEYLFIVSDGKSYGICSPTGKLILPLEYSIIDIDDDLCIVLKKNESDFMEIGRYNEKDDLITLTKAKMKDEVVLLDNEENYVWDCGFKFMKEERPNEWAHYSYKEALYDALGGEMDAIWNLD